MLNQNAFKRAPKILISNHNSLHLYRIRNCFVSIFEKKPNKLMRSLFDSKTDLVQKVALCRKLESHEKLPARVGD